MPRMRPLRHATHEACYARGRPQYLLNMKAQSGNRKKARAEEGLPCTVASEAGVAGARPSSVRFSSRTTLLPLTKMKTSARPLKLMPTYCVCVWGGGADVWGGGRQRLCLGRL